MKVGYCENCGKHVGHKRSLGFGTLFGAIFTGGLSLAAIPFYPPRCIMCGSRLRGYFPKSSLVLLIMIYILAAGVLWMHYS